MKTAAQALEDNLVGFMSTLDPHVRELPPRVMSVLTETVLGVFVLEYALRKKGLLHAEDVREALEDAQVVVERIQRHRGLTPVGSA